MIANGSQSYSRTSPSAAATAPGGKPAASEEPAWLQPIQAFVGERPVVCLGAAFAVGMVIAWYVKRTR